MFGVDALFVTEKLILSISLGILTELVPQVTCAVHWISPCARYVHSVPLEGFKVAREGVFRPEEVRRYRSIKSEHVLIRWLEALVHRLVMNAF